MFTMQTVIDRDDKDLEVSVDVEFYDGNLLPLIITAPDGSIIDESELSFSTREILIDEAFNYFAGDE